MKIIKPSVEILFPETGEGFLHAIERAGRVCYKSEEKMGPGTDVEFVKKMLHLGHHAMIEHAPSISMKFICDRGVSHEIVRHRLFSFAQESTRYCNYSNEKHGEEITVIEPCFWDYREDYPSGIYDIWRCAMGAAEATYFMLLEKGATPQEARSVLPNSLKTEIIVTGNARQWRHFFMLRTAKEAHPQMQEVAKMALEQIQRRIPIIFDGIGGKGYVR